MQAISLYVYIFANQDFSSDLFILFSLAPIITNPCDPSPCGPNSQCREINGQAVCSCLPQYTGAPPSCRPECTINPDCPQNRACSNQKCIDPCQGACGINALCQVFNHNPICTCPPGQSGNPFVRCQQEIIYDQPRPVENPCQPSPCGPNSECRVINEQASCTCLPNMIGSSPNCRPECVSNSECSSNLACINQKCTNPCVGVCGINAECKVVSHTPMCICLIGYYGDPFSQCNPKQQDYPVEVTTPCNPNPCGANAICKEQNNAGACFCNQDYIGNPYEGCRPECVLNSDCSSNQACINNKCKDPCPGACGQNAQCTVLNHNAVCSCISSYTGDPYSYCIYRDERKNHHQTYFHHILLTTFISYSFIIHYSILKNHKI
jgi:hypothetical protein